MLTFFVFSANFVVPSHVACSFLAPSPFNFRRILMRPTLVITLVVILFPLIVFSLGPP